MEGFATYYGQTSLHPLALVSLLLFSIWVLASGRRLALTPLFTAATTLPMSQRIVIAGADFTLMRILLLIYIARLFLRGEARDFRWGRVDTLVVLWTLSGTLIMALQLGTASALINRIGWMMDILATYFLTRCLVRRIDDVVNLAKVIAVVSIPVAALFFVEMQTQRNIFAVFGGVPDITIVREGKLRCQGPFAHSILAGTFWAATLPLMWVLWKGEKAERKLAVVGTFCAVLIVVACSSSTPLLSMMTAIVGAALFRFREHRKAMWIGLIALLLLLHLTMKAPVWHLMARVDLVGGSTGWHRYIIFDAFINNFRHWYLLGDPTPLDWGVWQMRDITNQFILEGLRGGLLTLALFVAVLLYSYGNVGRTLASIAPARNEFAEWVVWLIGVSLLVHTVTFFGVSYFGQMTALLYIHLGLGGAVLTALGPGVLQESKGGQPEDIGPARRRSQARPRRVGATIPPMRRS